MTRGPKTHSQNQMIVSRRLRPLHCLLMMLSLLMAIDSPSASLQQQRRFSPPDGLPIRGTRDARVLTDWARGTTAPQLQQLPTANPHEGHQRHFGAVTPAFLSLSVDGAREPAAISDERAYGHFLSAIASLKNAKARDAALKSVGFDLADRDVFIAALDPLAAELGSIEDQRKAGGRFESLRQQRKAALDAARGRMQSLLTRSGAAKLDVYVQRRVKTRIKVYSGGTMATKAELTK